MIISKVDMKQNRLKWVSALIVAAFLGWVACSANDIMTRKNDMVAGAKKTVTSISANELARLIATGAEISLLDVRTRPEFDQGHIRGSQWAPRGKLEFLAAGGNLAEVDSKIIVYCKKDSRAALAGKTLQDLGYTDVACLEGGFEAWVEAGFSIYNMHGEMTVKNFEKAEKDK